MCFNSIEACEIDLKKDLYKNIWLSGGTSMIPGLSTRLENDIKGYLVERKGKAILKNCPIEVHDPPRRKNAVFCGASFLATFSPEDRYKTKK